MARLFGPPSAHEVADEFPPPRSSLALHPRVAVLLGVERRWLAPLLACRALSMAPAAWWGLRCGLTCLVEVALADAAGTSAPWPAEKRSRVTEVFLSILWCSASAYLSFFFTDCLMSRWLLNYTPQATIVRLLTIDATNSYVTSWVLHLAGGSDDPRLLLPAWIAIASTLTVLYHLTQRKANIRRETCASLGVFSLASFASMCALLLQLHLTREPTRGPDGARIVPPLLVVGRRAWAAAGRLGRALAL
ncbi:MAG: hypothetical protein M1832_000344 [Thelocarpon impressellum]|nr:MAG: hypothetical protein M1832_000344 [Thelocarpon impressellum]